MDFLHGAFGGRAGPDALKPVVHRRISGQVDPVAFMGVDPRPAGDICDAVMLTSQPR